MEHSQSLWWDPALWLALATALGLALYVWGMWSFDRFAARALPFAPCRPFAGAALPFLLRRRSFAQHLQALYRSGRARPLLGLFHMRSPVLLLREPRLLRRALEADATATTPTSTPRRRLPPARPLHALLDKELDRLPGRQWRRVRPVLEAALDPRLRMRPQQLAEAAAAAQRLVRTLELRCAKGPVCVDVREPLERFWSEALGAALLGVRSRALLDVADPAHRRRRALLAAAAPSARALLLAHCPRVAKLLRIQAVPQSVEKYFVELGHQVATGVTEAASTEKGDIHESAEVSSEDIIKRSSALWYMVSSYLSDSDNREDVKMESRSRRDKTDAELAATVELLAAPSNQDRNRPARRSVTFAPDTELITITDPSSPTIASNESLGSHIQNSKDPISSASKMEVENITQSTTQTTTIPRHGTNVISKFKATETEKNENLETTSSANVSSKDVDAISNLQRESNTVSNVALEKVDKQVSDRTIPVVIISATDAEETLVPSAETVNRSVVKNGHRDPYVPDTTPVSLTSTSQSSEKIMQTIADPSMVMDGNSTSHSVSLEETNMISISQNNMTVDIQTDIGPPSTATYDGPQARLNPDEIVNTISENANEKDSRSRSVGVEARSTQAEPKSEKEQVIPLQGDGATCVDRQAHVLKAGEAATGGGRRGGQQEEGPTEALAPAVRRDSHRAEGAAAAGAAGRGGGRETADERGAQQPPAPEAAAKVAVEAALQVGGAWAEGGRRGALLGALALQLLGRHPRAQARAALEAQEAQRHLLAPLLLQSTLAHPDLLEQLARAAPYVHAVLLETLRLFPPSPLLTRAVCGARSRSGRGRGGGGVAVGAWPGDALWLPVGAAQRDARHWAHADAFRPERFLPEGAQGEGARSDAAPPPFLPFGLGPRACAGRELALLLATLSLLAVLARMEVVESGGGGGGRAPREARWRTTLEVQGGVRVTLRRRPPPHAQL